MATTIRARLYDGTPCCNNNAPAPEMQQSGWYVSDQGIRVRPMTNAEIVGYHHDPIRGDVNDETPPGLYIEYLPTGPLQCPECKGDDWDDMWADAAANLGDYFKHLEPMFRGLAMICSYIPVFGTAVSYVISTGLNLADGERLDDAMLDAVGEALPGQPMSGMAFNAARAVISGDGIDAVAIQALPDPPASPAIKKVVYVACELVLNIAKGENITDAALDQLSAQLPKQAQNAMSVARAMVNGQNVGDAAVAALGRQAADAMQNAATAANKAGKEAENRFISEAGYQAAIEMLPRDMQDGIRAGFAAQIAKQRQDVLAGAGFTTQEANKAANDKLALLGRQIEDQFASWVGNGTTILLKTIRNGSHWKMNRLAYNALGGTSQQTVFDDTIDDNWRRGFDIAIGLCEGLTRDALGQQKVRASLTILNAQRGFDAGQSIQFDRTRQRKLKLMSLGTYKAPIASSITSKLTLSPTLTPKDTNMQLGRVNTGGLAMAALSQEQVNGLRTYAAKGAAMAAASPTVAAARAFQQDGNWRWGFDIGSAVCQGNSIDGPGQTAVRRSLSSVYSNSGPNGTQGSEAAMTGFAVAQHLQYGLTKSGGDPAIAAAATNVPPAQAAGALVTGGVVGSNSDPATQLQVMKAVSTNATALAGAQVVVTAKKGFFRKLLDFFGL